MKKKLPDLITIDSQSSVPIYKQIVQCIFKGIDKGHLAQNDKLPSVNSIAERFELARGSVFSAYNELRASGIIDSIPGKGYFITSTQTKFTQNIFLLFSSLTPYTEKLYNSIVQNLPEGSRVDLFFHHHNKIVFENLIREEASRYNHFIIMPEIYEDTLSALSVLDPGQVFLIDAGYKEYKKHFPGIYQNFEKDLYTLLSNHQQLVLKYKRLFLLIPKELPGKDIISGFNRFAKGNLIETAVIHEISWAGMKKGDAFIVIDDDHLVDLVKCVREAKWVPGRDIGFLSYNETNLKSVVGDGVSTISPDYAAMGKSIAEMLLANERKVVENPFKMVDRHSF
ncbi:MAG: GntR family transcriptional regulator [Chitinophagaceae bacterium]|nr:MAG: GntR family transcriptional regulator [Chitinophagaceae bacterium]